MISICSVSSSVTARTPSVAKVRDRSTQSVISSVRGGTITHPNPMDSARMVDRTNGAASTSPMAMASARSRESRVLHGHGDEDHACADVGEEIS